MASDETERQRFDQLIDAAQKGTFIGWKWRFEAEGVEYVAGIGQG